MKKIMLGVLVIFVLLFTACSDDDDSTTEPEIVYGYGLEQFIPDNILGDMIIHDAEDDENWNELFYFWAYATDGFSPRTRNYDDMDWLNWEQGFYVPLLDNRVSFPQYTAQGIGAYNVKYLDQVCVYRGVQVMMDTLTVLFELNHMATEEVENYDEAMEAAIPLASFIPPHMTSVDSVAFMAVDGYAKTYTLQEIEAGYWLVDSQKTIFPGLDLPGSKKKFKYLKSMEIYGQYSAIEDWVNENLGAVEEADWSLSFPEDLSDYIGEVWE